jgi:hypothetical protein
MKPDVNENGAFFLFGGLVKARGRIAFAYRPPN